jgi:uncharacterized protein DUF1579
MKRTNPFAGASALACCTILSACASTRTPAPGPSAPGAQPAARTDPQAAYEPRSEPGQGQEFLARMAGDWDVVKTFYPRTGDPVVSRGACTQHMIHGGRFLESDFVFDDTTGRTTGTGIIGFDPQTGKFTSFWVDSRSTRVSVRASDAPFDGRKILLWGQTIGVGEAVPPARRSRTISTLEDGDRRLVHRQLSVSPDGQERPVMQLEMMRKP